MSDYADRCTGMRVQLSLETQEAMDGNDDGGQLVSRQTIALIDTMARHIVRLTERIEALEHK